MKEMSSRKRGGQPGNLNALKHGFYSRLFYKLERDELTEQVDDLSSELALLRVYLRRFARLMKKSSNNTEARQALDSLGMAATRIGSLMRTHYLLTGKGKEGNLANEIEKILSELEDEDNGED